MSEQKAESILSLALTGSVSGVLTCAVSFLQRSLGRSLISPSDIVFGAAMAWYFWRFRGPTEGHKLIVFVLGSVLAYDAAAVTAMFSPPLRIFFGFSDDPANPLPSDKFFFGGFVGALILLSFGYFFLSAKPRPKGFVLHTLGFSIVGGALAILGWSLGPSLGVVLGKSFRTFDLVAANSGNTINALRGNANAYSLFIIWQTGMALVLGGALPVRITSVNHEQN